MSDAGVPLYDLAPIARVMLLGVAIALGPLAWVWLRNRGQAPARRIAGLTLVTLFLTFDLIVFGSFTRLSDSGPYDGNASIVAWGGPACFGSLPAPPRSGWIIPAPLQIPAKWNGLPA